MRRLFVVILFIFSNISFIFGQKYVLSGKVQDEETSKGIEYVHIRLSDTYYGTITDKNGNFTLVANKPIDEITISCVGYKQKQYPTNGKKKITITLQKDVIQLKDYVFRAGENPAHRIIKNVYENIDNNSPESYSSYKCRYYSKSFFSSDVINDSLTNLAFLDTTTQKTEEDLGLFAFLSRQHIFLMESVIERFYKQKDRLYERVIASKISGFSDPIFHLLTTELKSFSFYSDCFYILGTPFENPIFDKKFKNYYFSLQDTLYDGADTIFVVGFKPFPDKHFRALTGEIYVHSNQWAVQRVVVMPIFDTPRISILIEQNYHCLDSNRWFPSESNAKISIDINPIVSYPISGYFRSLYSDVEIGIPIKNSLFVGGELYVDTKQVDIKQSDLLLNQYRQDTIDERDKNTYLLWDTITQSVNLDKFIYVLRALSSGKIPIGKLDLEIPRFFAYNKYEGCRLGIGVRTNELLLKNIEFGAFFAYGFRDEMAKAGFDVNVSINKKWQTAFFAGLTYDVISAGSTFESQFMHTYSFSLKKLNEIPSLYYDNIFKGEIGISSLLSRHLTATLGFSYQHDIALYDYNFTPLDYKGKHFNYDLAKLFLRLRLNFSRTILSTDIFTLTQKTHLPIVEVAYQRGLKIFDSKLTYNEILLKIQQRIPISYIGEFSYIVRGGYIDKSLPLASLYAVHGSYMAFGVFDRGVFSTMKANEFLSNKFISIHLSHEFNRLYNTKISAPNIELLYNMAFGGLKNPQHHQGIAFKTMEKGYYELGCMIHRILRVGFFGIGAGVYWRFGAYSLPIVSDNFSFRFSATLGR